MSEAEASNGRPPVFGDPAIGRWTLGSTVLAHWWSDPTGYPVKTRTELTAWGEVVRIHPGGPEDWIITIDFGPVQNRLHPTDFNPSQILAPKDLG